MSDCREGIYLEVTGGRVESRSGTNQVEFRNHFLVRPSGDQAVLYLLDDDLGLTGLQETQPWERVSRSLRYQPQLHARFLALRGSLGPLAQPQETSATSPAPAAPAAGSQPTRTQAPTEHTPWWELSRKGAEALIKK